MIEQRIYLHRDMRSHPVVGMGINFVRADKSKPAYTAWEGWVSLGCEDFVTQQSDGNNSVQLHYVGPAWKVTNIAAAYGWRAKDARRWVNDLAGLDLISDELSARLLSVLVKREASRRDALPPTKRSSVLAKTSGRCVYCGCELTTKPDQPNTYHPDHVLAVVKGGGDDIANLVPSCRTCNLKKGPRTMIDFLSKGTLA